MVSIFPRKFLMRKIHLIFQQSPFSSIYLAISLRSETVNNLRGLCLKNMVDGKTIRTVFTMFLLKKYAKKLWS